MYAGAEVPASCPLIREFLRVFSSYPKYSAASLADSLFLSFISFTWCSWGLTLKKCIT